MYDIRMPDMNSVMIAGNLTKDPVIRTTSNGTPVTNFWIASNRRFRDNMGQWRENVCFVGVVAWYKLAESCVRNLKKGNAVLIEGELQSRSLRSENGRARNIVEIKANRIQFLNKRDDSVSEEDLRKEPSRIDEPDEDDMMMESSDYNSGMDESAAPETDDSDVEQDIDEGPEEKSSPQAPPTPPLKEEGDNPDKGRFDFGYQNLEL